MHTPSLDGSPTVPDERADWDSARVSSGVDYLSDASTYDDFFDRDSPHHPLVKRFFADSALLLDIPALPTDEFDEYFDRDSPHHPLAREYLLSGMAFTERSVQGIRAALESHSGSGRSSPRRTSLQRSRHTSRTAIAAAERRAVGYRIPKAFDLTTDTCGDDSFVRARLVASKARACDCRHDWLLDNGRCASKLP
jgi:hypothetical protein